SGAQLSLGSGGGILGSGLVQRGHAARGPGCDLEDRVCAGKPGEGSARNSSEGVGGATSASMAFGWRRRIQRPEKFFRESMPEEVELVLTRPPGFDGLGDREVMELVRAEVARREGLHREKG